MSLNKLFFLEYVLLAAHQGKTVKQDDNVDWKMIRIILGTTWD